MLPPSRSKPLLSRKAVGDAGEGLPQVIKSEFRIQDRGYCEEREKLSLRIAWQELVKRVLRCDGSGRVQFVWR